MGRLASAAVVILATAMVAADAPPCPCRTGDPVTLGHPERPDANVGVAKDIALFRRIDGATPEVMDAALARAEADGAWWYLPAGTHAKVLGPPTLLPKGGPIYRLEVTEGKRTGMKAWVPAEYILLHQTTRGEEVPADPNVAELVPEPPKPPKPAKPGEPSAAHKAEIEKTIAQRRARKAAAARYLVAKKKEAEAEEAARRAYEAKMAPIIAKAQDEAARLNLLAQQTLAIQQMAAAQHRAADIAWQRYLVETQRIGVPRLVGPDGRVQPYPGGVSAPIYVLP